MTSTISKYTTVFFCITAILTFGCQSEGSHKNIPNVDNILIDLDFHRFEKELFSIDTNQIAAGLETLKAKYPEFSEIYFSRILEIPASEDNPERLVNFIRGFLTHPAVRQLYDTCMILYNNLDPEIAEFKRAFQYMKYYFPDIPTPDITTFISEFGVGNFIYKEQSLGLGLDFFLGADFPYSAYYPGNPHFSKYLTRSFTREHIVPKTLTPLIEELVGPPSGENLLAFLINNGKKVYILDLLLPFTADSVKLEITGPQVEWLEENESQIWAFFLQEDLLYSTEWQKFRKYVEYSPNSPGMPEEAPGRTANWIGWQVIKSYMEKNPGTTLQDLIAVKDPQKILSSSRYKPKK